MENFKKNLIEPFIPVRLNPILSTPEKKVWEDDEREWYEDDNPEGLISAMEFFDPNTDKYNYLRNYSLSDFMNLDVEEKFKIHLHHIESNYTKLASKIKTNEQSKVKEISKSDEKSLEYKSEKKIPSPYEIMDFLINNYDLKFVCYNSSLYLFDKNHYQYLDYDSAISFLMGILDKQMPLLGTVDFLNKVYDCFLRNPRIRVKDDEVDKHLISLNDGIFNICTEEFFAPNPNIFIPFHIDVTYRSYINSCPHFDRFLYETSGGDQAWIDRMWEILGYCLTNDNLAKSIFVFQGKMDSGKSMISSFLQSLFPKNITISMDICELKTQFGPANLAGKVLCTAPDLNPNSFTDATISWLKRISGGDNVSANVKYRKDFITFKGETRFLLSTNHLITTTVLDPAFIRRLVVLPFCFTVPIEMQDRQLFTKISKERDAIFKKAMGYAKKLREQNYIFSGNFKINEKECFTYSGFIGTEYGCNNSEIIEDFLFDALSSDENGFVSTDELYKLFLQKCNVNIPIQQFSKQCLTLGSELFPMKKVKRRISGYPNPINGFMGVKLIEE